MTTRLIPDASRRLRWLALLATALTVLAALPSCSPKVTALDSDYETVEGTPSPNSQLMLWSDEGVSSYFYEDRDPADPDPGDILDATLVIRAYPPGTLRGMVLDSTVADAYQVFRRESGGGFRPFEGFTLLPSRKWLGTQTEAYSFADRSPSSYAPPTYVARGVVDGVATSRSPLSNEVQLEPGGLRNIAASARWDKEKTGKLTITWIPVPGVERYLVQVYAFRSDMRSADEQVLSGVPSPLFDGKVTDYFVGVLPSHPAIVPPDSERVFVDSTGTDIKTILARPVVFGSGLLVRVAGLDAANRLIALTLGDPDPIVAYRNGYMGIQRSLLSYRLYRLSATVAKTPVVPSGPGGPEGS